ncbi:MAG: hypothetical protein ABMB14_00015 [Myxococcota bacterium]
MGRPSDPVLKWLRALVDSRGLNTASVAQKSGLPRARIRKILTGAEPMLVDELMVLSTALSISPKDMGLPDGTPTELPTDEPAIDPALAELVGAPNPVVDPWGNHIEQLFRVAFGLGCDFFFFSDPAELADSGIPPKVLAQFRDDLVPLQMKAEFHAYNNPRYDDDGITLTMSFDALYECRFPWTSVRRFIFLPTQITAAADQPAGPRVVEAPAPEASRSSDAGDAVEPEATPPAADAPRKGKPHLRLVD